MPVVVDCGAGRERTRAIAAAKAAARRGDVIVIPTESVYAIAVDAFSVAGVRALRHAKGYGDDHPLPVMVPSRSTVPGIAARVSAEATALMTACWPGQVTVLLDPQTSLAWDLPRDAPLAVRVPLHPVALAVLDSVGPMVVTSAGLPGLEEPRTAATAMAQAGGASTVVLDAGELVYGPEQALPSTVVDARTSPVVILRAGAVSATAISTACPGVVVP